MNFVKEVAYLEGQQPAKLCNHFIRLFYISISHSSHCLEPQYVVCKTPLIIDPWYLTMSIGFAYQPLLRKA